MEHKSGMRLAAILLVALGLEMLKAYPISLGGSRFDSHGGYSDLLKMLARLDSVKFR